LGEEGPASALSGAIVTELPRIFDSLFSGALLNPPVFGQQGSHNESLPCTKKWGGGRGYTDKWLRGGGFLVVKVVGRDAGSNKKGEEKKTEAGFLKFRR